ncbi:nitrogen fixation protein FixH [Roseovarius sp. MBR-154]|jgi:nitrogen fixation protein FixH
MAERQITGKHVFIGFAAAFSVIIGVNLVLAFSAVRTFPGLEVKNSYVASQEFNDRKAAQEGLGWTIAADHQGGMLTLGISDEAGQPVEVARLEATVGRATHVQDDQTPEFRFDGSAYVAPVALGDGNWNIRMKAWDEAGTLFQQRVVLHKD